jgi:lipopolysaccharide/colanic/teichoic acid biosynthesis glycosyltransferase
MSDERSFVDWDWRGVTQRAAASNHAAAGHPRGFFEAKRGFDVVVSLLLLPVVAASALLLLLLNPIFNPGPLFFRQPRMGLHCQPFEAIKFRSMLPAGAGARGADDPLEVHRITPLGELIRRMRLDELPQVLNVLKGDMSLIGPRPDFLDHAEVYLETVPGYRKRHMVRPGISGLAQTEVGYVQGIFGTRRKVSADLYYIFNAGWRLEAFIFWRTLVIVFTGRGS